MLCLPIYFFLVAKKDADERASLLFAAFTFESLVERMEYIRDPVLDSYIVS